MMKRLFIAVLLVFALPLICHAQHSDGWYDVLEGHGNVDTSVTLAEDYGLVWDDVVRLWVPEEVITLTAGDARYVNITGDIMTGDLEINDDLDLTGLTPHLRFNPTVGDSYEWYAHTDGYHFTNVTDSLELLWVRPNDDFYFLRNIHLKDDKIFALGTNDNALMSWNGTFNLVNMFPDVTTFFSKSVNASAIATIQYEGTKDYTAANELVGANGNFIFGSMKGDYEWGMHLDQPASGGGDAVKHLALGLHNTNGVAAFIVADDTNNTATPIRIFQAGANGAVGQDIMRINGAEFWQDNSNMGTFTGDFLHFRNAQADKFRVTSTGAIVSGPGTHQIFGTELTNYLELYQDDVNNVGVIKTVSDSLTFWSGNSIYKFFDSTAGGEATITMDASDNMTITPTGTGDLILSPGGQVGIGTPTPNEQLEITGNFRLPATTATTGIFYQAANRFLHTFGTADNIFLGVVAGNLTNTSNRNVGIGTGVLGVIGLNANDNVGIGWNALTTLTTGDENFALGNKALRFNSTGSFNTAIGALALEDNLASNNIAIGASAGKQITSGAENVSMGVLALDANLTGGQNTSIGHNSGTAALGSGNIFLGHDAGAQETGSNTLYIDNSNTTTPLIGGDFSTNVLTINGDLGIGTATPDFKLHVVGDAKIETKLDIGVPGAGGGLDIGEGGSYTLDSTGAVIVQAFSYDASASSGSRFTELTLDASNTFLGDAGDRFYVGSTKKFWAVRFNPTTAKSTEQYDMKYWNGAAVSMDHMTILKDSATSDGDSILEQIAEKEYTTWDHAINTDWATADDVTDEIPDGSSAMYWVYMQVPVGDLATAPVVDEIKVRGTDFDIVSGASYPIFWGQARVENHERIPLTIARSPGGTGTTNIDIDSAHQQTVFNFNGAGDNLSFLWTIPEGTDTSSKIEVKLDYSSNAADTYSLDLTASKLLNNTAINNGVSPDYTSSTDITTAAAATFYIETTLMATKMSIENLTPNDVISFELQRTDAANAFYPMNVTLHYVVFSTGEHI